MADAVDGDDQDAQVTALINAASTSNFIPELGVAGSARQAITTATMPIGTLIANSHGQLATDRMAAAAVGPAAEAIDPMVALIPSPRPIQTRG